MLQLWLSIWLLLQLLVLLVRMGFRLRQKFSGWGQLVIFTSITRTADVLWSNIWFDFVTTWICCLFMIICCISIAAAGASFFNFFLNCANYSWISTACLCNWRKLLLVDTSSSIWSMLLRQLVLFVKVTASTACSSSFLRKLYIIRCTSFIGLAHNWFINSSCLFTWLLLLALMFTAYLWRVLVCNSGCWPNTVCAYIWIIL